MTRCCCRIFMAVNRISGTTLITNTSIWSCLSLDRFNQIIISTFCKIFVFISVGNPAIRKTSIHDLMIVSDIGNRIPDIRFKPITSIVGSRSGLWDYPRSLATLRPQTRITKEFGNFGNYGRGFFCIRHVDFCDRFKQVYWKKYECFSRRENCYQRRFSFSQTE